jgi:hypothetical protein
MSERGDITYRRWAVLHAARSRPPAGACDRVAAVGPSGGAGVRLSLRVLRWVAFAAATCACDNDATSRGAAPLAPPPSSAPARAPHPFGDARGLIITANDVFLSGVSLGIVPARLAANRSSLSERLRELPPAVTLSYTRDAPAEAVLSGLRAVFESGHARVELVTAVDGTLAAACTLTAAPADAATLKVELHGDRVELGLSEVRPVLHRALRDRELAAQLRDDLAAPFFDQVRAVEIAVDTAATGGELHRVMTALCGKLAAWRATDFAPIQSARARPTTLPLCRKLIVRSPASAYDPELLRASLPVLDAMDLCYSRFARAPGPAGTVTMTLEIEPDGTVGDHAATGLDAAVDRCIGWLVGRSRFPRPPAAAVRVRATVECNTRCCNGD